MNIQGFLYFLLVLSLGARPTHSAIIRGDLCMHERIVKDENSLVGHCRSSCEEIPEIPNDGNCEKVSNCSTRYRGGLCGFHRNDWCECICSERCDFTERCALTRLTGVTVKRDFMEPEVNGGSCIGKCETVEPYVAPGTTLLHGCKRVSNCQLKMQGWNRGFVRCDLCSCDCELPPALLPGMVLGTAMGQCVNILRHYNGEEP